ncbi:hypothetical protein FRC02_009739 [Tulasnella sp. 418]|nr:hypothetical protein FRC02_009739 [Tulasnella sp. 418]
MESTQVDEVGRNIISHRGGHHWEESNGNDASRQERHVRDYSQQSLASTAPLMGGVREDGPGTIAGTGSPPEIRDPYGELYAHLKRPQVGMMSIGGAIGTGLFLRSNEALASGGPLGALLAYGTFGTVVYSLNISISEMSAAYPDVGGPIGLANKFVDPALGFSTGWNAWYNWSITIPAQIAAATALVNYWDPPANLATLWPTIFLIFVIGINLGGATRYGNIEFVFSIIKITTVIALVILGIAINLGAGDGGFIGFKYWVNPGPFAQYMRIEGAKGQFLGFWAVFMQAAFAYFGCEIPGIVASEVKNAHWAVPRASKNTVVRLTVLYLSAMFVAGILVPHNCGIVLNRQCTDPAKGDDAPWRGSPFLIALEMAGAKFTWVRHFFVACFVISAASAASAGTFISSRYMYYMARTGHAPRFFGGVYRLAHRDRNNQRANIPWVGLAFSVLFSSLSYMTIRPGTNEALRPELAFDWMASMTTAASLQSWIGMLFTYIRFYHGTRNLRNRLTYKRQIEYIEKNRNKYQPWLAYYALFFCSSILLFHGWALFRQPAFDNKKWVVYQKPGEDIFPRKQVAVFVTTYMTMPLFLLLSFGYKLINQTRMVSTRKMRFDLGCGLDSARDPPNDPIGMETKPETRWGKIWWILVA